MKSVRHRPWYLGLFVFVFSCKSLVNDVNFDDLPVSTPKIVAHGYLSPQDTLIAVRVAYSTPAFGTRILNQTTSNLVEDLGFKVSVSDGSKTVNLAFNKASSGSTVSGYEISAKQLPITTGKTYQLKVVAKDGETVTASCQIPQPVAIKEAIRDSILLVGDTRKTQIVKIRWQDPKGKGNYYRIGGDVYDYLETTVVSTATAATVTRNYTLNNIPFDNRYGDFQDDQLIDGELMTSGNGKVLTYSSSTNYIVKILSRQIDINLISCEKAYYDYHNSIQKYQSGNPFAEPTLVSSNVKGGLGCFAGYNKVTAVLK